MKKVLEFIFIVICVHLFIGGFYLVSTYGHVSGDELFFHLLVPIGGVNSDCFVDYFLKAVLPTLIIAIGSYFLFKKKSYKNYVYIGMFILSFTCFIFKSGLNTYIVDQVKQSDFIKDNYVEVKDVSLEFPEKKRNLIYIYLESMENTYSSVKNGGIKKDNLIPNLTRISKENVNFSNGGELGGALSINGSAWTAAAMVSQTSGLPLKINSSSNGIIDFNNFMPNVTTLGDILEDNGYNNYLLVGSDSTYGSRKTYFEQHGNYSVYDVNSAIDDKVIREDEKVWWGFDDNLLFELAKEKLLEISSNDEPFNYTMLTVDTHFEDGYLADDCDEKFNDQYSDVMYCADRKINEFLEWIKEQDFYENTTVILVGDHLSMDVDYFDDVEDDYVRTTYNAFINPLCDTDRCSGKKTNREFTSLDMFPTTLASLGVKIDGERLALGTNLFSLKKTIVEEYGYEHVFNELKLRSSFYNDNFLAYK